MADFLGRFGSEFRVDGSGEFVARGANPVWRISLRKGLFLVP